MGDTNRVAIFGFLGLGLYYDRLDIDPSLPPQIVYLNYRTFYWMGHGINATSNATHTTLSRLPREKYTLATAYFDKPIPVTVGTRSGRNSTVFQLGDEPLIIPNRPIGETLTVAGNLLQCGNLLTPPQANKPGQFPIAAIDGAASTKWQPELSNVTSFLTVDLGGSTFRPVNNIMMDWGEQPPSHFEIYFTNSSLTPFSAEAFTNDVRNVTGGKVESSAPWDPVGAFEIRTYVGNQTNITLSEAVWSGRFAHLGVKGNQYSRNAMSGGTVAEWNLIREM